MLMNSFYLAMLMHAKLHHNIKNFKDGIEGCKMGKVSLPDSYTKLVESSTSKNNGDSTNFDIKLKPGITFAGNHVMAIEQWTGHSNGIWGSALVLEEKDINAVKKNIAQSGTKLKKSKSEMGENGAQILKGTDGKVRIVCDLSD
jgi:hypothetical protein